MIKFNNVTKIYYSDGQAIEALNNVSFSVAKGEFVCLTGRCGAGKTTLIKLLIGQEQPTKGKVLFEGQDVPFLKLKALQHLRRQIGVVYQDYKLLEDKTVGENLEYVMEVIGASFKDIARDIPQILGLVGLADRARSMPEELSGGERQCLAVARALCHRPKVLVADEPTGNLDSYETSRITHLLERVNQMGMTVILATHDKGVVDRLKKRLLMLENGRLVRDTEHF